MPVPRKFVAAFRNAIVAYANWRSTGGLEPRVNVDRQNYSIGAVADYVATHDSDMPEEIYAELCTLATPVLQAQHLETPLGKTFKGGGRCLRAMFDELVEHCAKRD